MKICCACKKRKRLGSFYKNKWYKDGLSRECKKCRSENKKVYYKKNRIKILKQKHKAYLRDRKKFLDRYRIRKYGVSVEEFEKQIERQNNRCAICGVLDPSCVDHCHKMNKNRGILCDNCNLGLGQFKDDVVILKEAINYLEKPSWFIQPEVA